MAKAAVVVVVAAVSIRVVWWIRVPACFLDDRGMASRDAGGVHKGNAQEGGGRAVREGA